jgi:hypothetical protein
MVIMLNVITMNANLGMLVMLMIIVPNIIIINDCFYADCCYD